MSAYARTLAEFAFDAYIEGIGDERLEGQVGRVLDVIGNGLAAVEEEAAAAVAATVVEEAGAGRSLVFGTTRRLAPADAALVNGTLAHALDFDDTHLPSVLHPSACVVPAAIAVGEQRAVSGSDLLRAVAIGNEIVCRLGMAGYDPSIRNSVFFEKGQHATSICGTFGAAVAATLLMGGDTEAVANAIGISASMGAGIIEANRTGGTVKRIHCGWAAHGGVTAARLAMAGITGPPTVLEGRFGFYQAHTDGFLDEELLVGKLGEHWEIDRLFYKPYPTNHFTHAGIDAALNLKQQEGVDPEHIVGIKLGAPAPVLRTIAEPAAQKAAPQNGYYAKFSAPYTVAAALVGGDGLGVGAEDFTDDAVKDPQRLRLAQMVECYPDEHASEVFPHQFPAVLTITLDDGTVVEHRVEHNRGGPERPLALSELETKFTFNAAKLGTPDQVAAVAAAVSSLPTSPDVRAMGQAIEAIGT